MHWLRPSLIVVDLTAICLFVGCAPKSGDTSGDTGDTAGTAGASETSAAPPTTSATDPSDSETAGTDTPTTADPTTGEPLEPLPAACQNLCADMVECGLVLPPDQEQCFAGCIAPEEPGSDCAALLAAEWNCVSALSCEDIKEFTQVQPHMCLKEVGFYDSTCAQN